MCSDWHSPLARAAAVALTATAMFAADQNGAALFETKIRPLLAQQCLACHSASSNPVMGGLRLDSRDALLQGGSRGPAIVPGKPEQSLLLRAVRHTEGKLQMPPGGKLKDADIAVLAQWIQQGAPWGAHPPPAANAEKYCPSPPPPAPPPPPLKNR